MDRYQNRKYAGQILANYLSSYANRDDVIVLALPRGGVPVAYEIAEKLNAPLDVFIVRKIGVPGHAELAMGAIASGEVKVFNEDIIDSLQIPDEAIRQVITKEKEELKRREHVYRGDNPFPNLQNKTVILVDDGIATGASMRAAIQALKLMQPARLIVAVPVAAYDLAQHMSKLVDEFICPLQPYDLHAVGLWYENFTQTEDDEVFTLLNEAKHV